MIQACFRLFDRVIVAVARNPDKKYTFTLDERVRMVDDIATDAAGAAGLFKVEALPNQLVANYAIDVGATHLVRGIRNIADFESEFGYRHVNADIAGIETVFLVPPRELCQVSSSMVKSLIGFDGGEKAVETYVNPRVLERLKRLK